MKRIISLILAFCLILTLAPVLIYATEPTEPGYGQDLGTPIADYILNKDFSESDFGKFVISNDLDSSDNYSAIYSTDGVSVTRTAEGGTTSKPINCDFAINFAYHEKDENNNTEYFQKGFSGKYAIDITFNYNLVPTGTNSGRTDIWFSDVVDNHSTSVAKNHMRIMPNANIIQYYGGTSKVVSFETNSYTDYTLRMVTDTETSLTDIYLADNSGTYTYYGQTEYGISSNNVIGSMLLRIMDYLEKESSVTFKNIKIYEIKADEAAYTFKDNLPDILNGKSGNPLQINAVNENIEIPSSWAAYKVESSNSSVLSVDGTITPTTVDKDVTLTVSGVDSGIVFKKVYNLTILGHPDAEDEDEPTVPEKPVDPNPTEKLLFDYVLNKDFVESELGKLVIEDTIDDCGYEFETVYGNDGISIVKYGEPVYEDAEHTSADEVDAFAINLVELVDNDTENHNRVYKTGFDGVYALELTLNVDSSDTWATNTDNKSSGRTDLFFGNKVNKKATLYGYENYINIRVSYKALGVAAHSGSDKFSFKNRVDGQDMTLRLVFDTINNKMVGYSLVDGKYEKMGEVPYTLDAITHFWYRARPFMEKGDKITFKRVKMYEIKKKQDSTGETTLSKFMTTAPDTFLYASGEVVSPMNVVGNIVIPDALAAEYTVETMREAVISNKGDVIRGLEDTVGNIKISNSITGFDFHKIYDFNIKAKDEVIKEHLVSYDYKSTKITDALIATGDCTPVSEGVKLKGISSVVGFMETIKSSDANTKTYYFDHNGAYDFELSVIPDLNYGNSYIEVGNYNPVTEKFETYGKLMVDSNGIYLVDKYENISIVNNLVNKNEYKLKFRVDVENGKIWAWANSSVALKDGMSFGNATGIMNAYRISIENGTDNESITLTNGNLTKLVYRDVDNVASLIQVVNSIGISDITTNFEDAYGDIKLPELHGYDINWSADNYLVDLENKKIYRGLEDEDITLTLTISNPEHPRFKVKKEFYLKVKKAQNHSERIEGALVRITSDSVTNQKQIVADLKLPSKTIEGYDITWESLSKGYVSDKGVINKGINISKPTDVKFKVTVSLDGESLSKEITFTLAKRGADVVLAPTDISVSAEGVVTYKATVSGNGNAYLKDGNDNNIVGFIVNGGKISFDYKNTDNVQYDVNDSFEIEVVMNSIDQCASILIDGKVVLDYVPYLASSDGFKSVVSTGLNFDNQKVVLDEYSLFDYNVKVFDYVGVFGNFFVSENRSLLDNSIGGVSVKWKSSNEGIMTNDGMFSKPLAIEFFDMTLTLSGDGTTNANVEKVLNCVAVPDESKNLFNNSIVSVDMEEDVNNKKALAFDNDFTTYFGAKKIKSDDYILIELENQKIINSLFFFQNEGSGIESCDIYLSKDGTNWGEVVASPIFSDIKSNYVMFEYQDAKYIKITNISAKNSSFELYELKGYLSYTADNKAQIDINALVMPTEYNLTATALNLPEIGAIYGSKLIWTSTKPNVISTDGKIVRANIATEVVLTVIAEIDGVTTTKKFTYLVPAASSGGASGGSGGGAGGSYAGSISGVNSGGAGVASTPGESEVELEKIETPIIEKGIFADTPKNAWYYDYMVELNGNGIVNGYEDGKFYPDKNVTREEFLKMLIVATNIELTDKTFEFTDIDINDWYAPYVYTAKNIGISNGISTTEFGAGMPISRQDMAVMIYNVLTNNVVDNNQTELFADHSEISWYAYNAVYAMKNIGILNGYENGDFRPAGNLTRAEAVKVVALILKMKKN